jgi:AAA ATPase domain
MLVLRGPAGIGKSELLTTVRASARARGFGVLTARGSEFEQEIAFGVARQLFEPMLRAASPVERGRLLDGVARLGARALGVEEGEPPADRFAAIHGLFWLCANRAGRGPLVLAVDDVQSADDPSLAWLGYLARRIGDLAVVLVLVLRTGDPSGNRSGVVHLVGEPGGTEMVLAPLSAGAVATLVRRQLDEGAEEPFCGAMSELSSGNPFLVRELVAAAREQRLPARGDSVVALQRIAPAAVGTSALSRLGRLGEEAAALARAVAVLGGGTEVRLAAQLAGLDLVAAELTADRLADAQILAPIRPLEFVHPLVGAAVQEDIAPGALRVAHRRAAELLETEGEGELGHIAAPAGVRPGARSVGGRLS